VNYQFKSSGVYVQHALRTCREPRDCRLNLDGLMINIIVLSSARYSEADVLLMFDIQCFQLCLFYTRGWPLIRMIADGVVVGFVNPTHI